MISDFLKNIAGNPLRLVGGPLAAVPQILKGVDKSYSPVKDLSGLVDSVAGTGVADSWLNSQTGAGPTGVQQWQANREDTAYQRATEDMQAAGLNPAMMYGRGGQPAAANAGSSNGAGLSLSDMLELSLLPVQIENIKADTALKNANAGNVAQRTLTEYEITRIKRIAADYGVELTEANLEQIASNIALNRANADLKVSEKDFVESKTDAQNILNEYLPQRQVAELGNIAASTANMSEQAKLAKARAWMESIQANFAANNDYLMSSNDTLLVATYIASLFGISKNNLSDFLGNLFRSPRSANGGSR